MLLMKKQHRCENCNTLIVKRIEESAQTNQEKGQKQCTETLRKDFQYPISAVFREMSMKPQEAAASADQQGLKTSGNPESKQVR